ncbi:amidohydrolase [Kordiimonas sediminis]|uniref:Amidohydrolase n=1 Tax=Kordiimonas sediminis TaxID=1735581 RepID=A0A919AIJ9_9PROT|nr:carbon-nitrogen hydrolase family protein [Kordiimonas sediminis]GHF10510.1 amidohydrolase [Kordiimonas sediminis]
MHVALIQMTSSNDVAENIEAASTFIKEAAKAGARYVQTPETTHLMEMNRQSVLEKARAQEDDPGVQAFSALAKELGIWLHIGSLIIKTAEDRLANRAFLFGPDGCLRTSYDKLHLFDVDLDGGESYRESRLYDHGSQGQLVKTPDASIGISICYDLRFPYLYREMAQKGADILTVPAAFTKPTGEAHWYTLLRARAIENGAFVLAAAQTGLHATGRETYGHSLIIDPWGAVLVDAGTDTGVVNAVLDLEMVAKIRQRIPSLKHSRDVSIHVTDTI